MLSAPFFITAAGIPLLLAILWRIFYPYKSLWSHSRLDAELTEPRYPTNVVNLTHILVSMDSTTGSEAHVFGYVLAWAKFHNYSVVTQHIAPLVRHELDRENLLILHPEANQSQIRVVLSTHLDTVAVSNKQNTDTNDARKIRGRGSVDAKGQAAAMLVAAIVHIRHPQVAVLLVCGEESDHAGMSRAHELGLGPIALVNGEPTESKIATSQKGAVRMVIDVTGKAAHSGYPHLGDSAVHKLIDLLQQLRRETCTEEVTMNIGNIEGGVAANVVADHASASVLWRVVGNATSVVSRAEQIVKSYQGAMVQTLRWNDGINFFVPNLAKEVGTTTVAYNTDVPFFKGQLVRTVLFGGGSIFQAHSEDEYIERCELERLPHLYEKIALELVNEMSHS